MQTIEPSGVFFKGECAVQTPKCTAKAPATITAVWSLPGRDQIDVCRACLEEMVRLGEWKIEGARIPQRVDLAVRNQNQELVLAVEVRLRPLLDHDLQNTAIRIRRNMIAHAGIPLARFFMLAFIPTPFHLWVGFQTPESAPNYTFDPPEDVKRRFSVPVPASRFVEGELAELVLKDWLMDLIDTPRKYSQCDWFTGSGLEEALRGGTVIPGFTY